MVEEARPVALTQKERNDRHYAKHKEELKSRARERYWADPEKSRAEKRADHAKHRDERNAKALAYYEAHRAEKIAYQAELNRTEPYVQRKRIYSQVQNEKRRGRIVYDACEDCGKDEGRLHAHHDDYERPLDVVILCPSCHGLRHTLGGQ